MKISNFLYGIRKYFASKEKYISLLREKGVNIGSNCDISKSALFSNEPYLITIGDNVRITQRVKFITHDGGLWTLRKMGLIDECEVKYGRIYVGDNSNISWDVTIMPGVRIGKNCVIAAGAIVTKNVPDGEVWGGVPAHKIETIQEYYHKIQGLTLPTNGMGSAEKRRVLEKHIPM